MKNEEHKVNEGHKVGDIWINLISGLEYKWDGEKWASTKQYPYGTNPMGFLGDGTTI